MKEVRVPAAWMTGAQRGAYEERLRIAAEDRRSGT
jgi:hypothetical protein